MNYFIYTYYNNYLIIIKITYTIKIKYELEKYALISLK